ncbi:SWIM zinc finger family protein [Actinophytocola sediminis]
MTAWFSEEDLHAAAGEASFRRGREYVAAVGDMQPTALGVRARVSGTDTYEVWLGRDGERLVGECDCPFGADGNFCKHCVAVGLVLIEEGRDESAEPDITGYLGALDRRELVDLVLAQAARDPVLYRKLSLRAAGTAGAPQVAVLRRQLDDALAVRGYLDHQATLDYARRATDALTTIVELLDAGHAAEARPLARGAVEAITAAMSTMDDLTGAVVGVCRRAFSLYAKACTAARPNPGKLAGWLVRFKVDGPGWPTLELAEFVDALGAAGLAEYRTLVARVAEEAGADRTLVVRAMRAQLAEVDGDLDAHVDILAEGVPNPTAFLGIANLLRDKGQLVGAIRWAERGLEETGDPRLADVLIRSYVDDGRPSAAVAVREQALRAAPTRQTYANLRATAELVGEWPAAREGALDVLRAAAERGDTGGDTGGETDGDADELVGALLDDGEPEEAWQAADKHGCGDRVWLEVARIHGRDHPADVLAGYRRVIENRARRTGRDAYREVAMLLEELRELAALGATDAAFTTVVADLRARNPRRRGLLAELDRRGL